MVEKGSKFYSHKCDCRSVADFGHKAAQQRRWVVIPAGCPCEVEWRQGGEGRVMEGKGVISLGIPSGRVPPALPVPHGAYCPGNPSLFA